MCVRGWINLDLRMNKFLLSAIALLTCVCVYARDYSIKVDTTSVPSAAQEVLVQRFTQMLEAGGIRQGAAVVLGAARPVRGVRSGHRARQRGLPGDRGDELGGAFVVRGGKPGGGGRRGARRR